MSNKINPNDPAKVTVSVKLPTTSDLFKKHFPEVYGGAGVGLFHPNIESFFSELNDVCLIQDSLKQLSAYSQSIDNGK